MASGGDRLQAGMSLMHLGVCECVIITRNTHTHTHTPVGDFMRKR